MLLPAFGIVIYLMRGLWYRAPDPLEFAWFVLVMYVLGGLGWLLLRWRPSAGRWFAVLATMAICHLMHAWLRIPGSLVLLSVSVALCTHVITPGAALAVAAGETLLLLAARRALAVDPSAAGTALLGIWATLGIDYLAYRPTRDVLDWSWRHYLRAQQVLEEARDRKAELAQALEDLIHANRQLALANERVAALRLVAEEAQRAKAAFVARVSHEFRTPLNVIIGMIDLMVGNPAAYQGEFPAKALVHLGIVHRNCLHLSEMIDDVLDLSAMEAGRMAIHREPVDLAELVAEAVAMVQPMMNEKGLLCRVQMDSLPELQCDRVRIRQVILNLLSNAARFTVQGGITVSATCQGEDIVISVADTGPGISAEDVARVFEPFYKGDARPWHAQEGSGLGLSISNQFVKLHGGRMWVESTPGVGSTFFIDLPLAAPGQCAKPSGWIREDWVWRERRSRPALPGSHYRPRFVVCDSSGELHRALSRRASDVELVHAPTLAGAIQELRACPAQALMVNSPSLERLMALVEAAQAEVSDTPIIGYSCASRIDEILRAGARGYLTKPLRRDELFEVMQQCEPLHRVLVVDDDASARELLSLLVQAYDPAIEVVLAADGEEALAELAACRADLVLLDLVMPGLDGWQVLARKNGDDRLRDVPVILVSAQDVLPEPGSSPVLVAAVSRRLSLSKLLDCSQDLAARLLLPD